MHLPADDGDRAAPRAAVVSAPKSTRWIVTAGVVLAFAGCGFKGPLYLPERNATVVTHPAAAAQSAAPQGRQPASAVKQKSRSPQGSAPPTPSPPLH